MTDLDRSAEQLLEDLQERAKELNCLYKIDEILSEQTVHEDTDVLRQMIPVIPTGWKYPEICQARITMGRNTHQPDEYVSTPWTLEANIHVQGETVGTVAVSYREERPSLHEGPFLREERRLIEAIAERLALWVMQRRLRQDRESWERVVSKLTSRDRRSWRVLVEFLMRTDQQLSKRITRRMVHHLCWNGVTEAGALLQEGLPDVLGGDIGWDENQPQQRQAMPSASNLVERTFELAGRHLSETEIVSAIQSWIAEDQCVFLLQALENQATTMNEIADAVLRFRNAALDESQLSLAFRTSIKVGLLRRVFLDQLDFINVAKQHVEVRDFYDLVPRIVYPPRSQGKLGGKAAGLFQAEKILTSAAEYADLFRNLKFPRTWYVASDGILDFIQSNGLNEVYDRKYLPIERVRRDYRFVIQLFKNSRFTQEITKGLSAVLDDFDDRPLIVRSSSMLEDRAGASFSGKYKSLFLANQGTKRQRLEALQDAIAEIWASVFGPDPIEYRAERGLLDFREEMGVLVQEVVGTRIGKYFLPAFSGVAFSNAELRWSPRITREDGLVRMVAGLGTRAVDRVSDDYPILVSPGQPGLRVNVTTDEATRYSPKRADVINLDAGRFETIDLHRLLRGHGEEYPLARRLVSITHGDELREPMGLEPDWGTDPFVVTFESLIAKTPFLRQIKTVLTLLSERLGVPVDVEFASDGADLYILQCRAQSRSEQHAPDPIPRDLPRDKVLFSAHRYVANGRVPPISHIVYVDPDGYARLSSRKDLLDVARAVGKLNAVLPKGRFILIGPGRWGSRGDIKLGVNVTYSDISNTAMLIEVARKKGNYVPELSFGTHFFQDLVESGIRYLPLYPDEAESVFQERFFTGSANLLPDMLPEFARLGDTVRVIDVPRERDGAVLRVLMNADLEHAVGVLMAPTQDNA